jgi:cytoskeletal protein CcmA (bactofilin family)
MSSNSEHEVAADLNKDQDQTLPVQSESVNAEQQHGKRSVIGKAVHIKGDISARENVQINGRVAGTIALKMNELEVGIDGHVEANIFASTIIVSGEVLGDLYAYEVLVTETGRITGDIYTQNFSMKDGARITGNIDMQKQDVFKQHAVPEIQDEHQARSSGFGFLFKKGRDTSHTDTMLLPDLREDTEISEERAIHAGIIHLGAQDSVGQSILGESVVIKGELISEEDVIIQGHLDGVIYFKNCSLGVGVNAEIKANIFVESLVHHGLINGDIYASKQVNFKKPGQVDGNIFSPRVSTEGAVIRGSIKMESQNIEEIYDRLYGAATATLIEEEVCEVNVVTEQADIVEDVSQDMPNRNSAWPIFYPRT